MVSLGDNDLFTVVTVSVSNLFIILPVVSKLNECPMLLLLVHSEQCVQAASPFTGLRNKTFHNDNVVRTVSIVHSHLSKFLNVLMHLVHARGSPFTSCPRSHSLLSFYYINELYARGITSSTTLEVHGHKVSKDHILDVHNSFDIFDLGHHVDFVIDHLSDCLPPATHASLDELQRDLLFRVASLFSLNFSEVHNSELTIAELEVDVRSKLYHKLLAVGR